MQSKNPTDSCYGKIPLQQLYLQYLRIILARRLHLMMFSRHNNIRQEPSFFPPGQWIIITTPRSEERPLRDGELQRMANRHY